MATKPTGLTKEELIEAHIIANPDLWAETHLRNPMNPDAPLELRRYQRKCLRDRHYRKLLRWGRRTGKSVYLAIEALWKAFTYAHRQVLLTAAYETQIDGLFDIIRRMAFDSPAIKDSISGFRKKPYELWFNNGSVIRGLVANASIRGKCLIAGTMVWMADGSWKPIEKVRPGEEVITLNPRTTIPEKGKVVQFYENGVKPVYELRTTTARRLIATANHPLFVFANGWTPVSEIKTKEEYGRDAHFIAIVDAIGQLNWARVASIHPVGKMPTYDIEVADYHHFIAFYPTNVEESGFTISGLSNGGILVHNSADDLIIDEGDYIPQDVLLADIWPIATTYKHTTVIFSSTPSGRREFFWKISVNKHKPEFNFHEYHIPSTMSPEWTSEQEALVKAITSRTQYEHEYLAEFGEMAEGVFRHADIDRSLYVYDYRDLKYNPNNYYTLGVDWNEAKNGVQIVLVEFLNEPAEAIPYNQGDWSLKNRIVVKKKFRIFGVWEIDAVEYTNTRAVDEVIEVMKHFPPNYAIFDHGHGHTNWELLRLALMRGETSTGKKCPGMKHLLERMDVLDFGSRIETIDPYTQTKQKHKAKNFIVKLTSAVLENGMIMIPAIDEKGTPVEDNERALVPQMRDYNIARYGQQGEIYEPGPSGDHRLDAFMLALYAYGKEHDQFLRYNFNLQPQLAGDHITPAIAHNRLITREHNAPMGFRYTKNGILVRDYGNWPGRGEPPDNFDEDSGVGLLPSFGHQPRSSRFSKRGSRGL